jgi:hypothetical protein
MFIQIEHNLVSFRKQNPAAHFGKCRLFVAELVKLVQNWMQCAALQKFSYEDKYSDSPILLSNQIEVLKRIITNRGYADTLQT